MNKLADWYEQIEVSIRGLVRLLRNNGINTYWSCGHEMKVLAENYTDDELTKVYDLLVENGYKGFRITVVCRQFEEWPVRHMEIVVAAQEKITDFAYPKEKAEFSSYYDAQGHEHQEF